MDFRYGYSEKYYLLRCKDVRVAVENGFFKNGFEHFSQFGHKEGRDGGEYFDSSYYLKTNPDVANAVAAGAFSGFEHFLKYGASEGRTPFAGFSQANYFAKNVDVAQAFNNGSVKSAWEHFTTYGEAEGRQGFSKIPTTYGTAGNDFLTANGKDGFVFGDAGNDVINVGGVGITSSQLSSKGFYWGGALSAGDKIYGNQGADIFNFNTNPNPAISAEVGFYKTTIMDFSIAEGDKIRIDSPLVNNFGDMLFVMKQNADGDATFNIAGANNLNNVIVLEDISASQVTSAMFEFV